MQLSDKTKRICRICLFNIPQRYILYIMCFFALANAYTMRVCVPITIPRMVKKRFHNDTSSSSPDACPDDSDGNTPSDDWSSGTYDWSEARQGVILSSFYIGYFIAHIVTGQLVDKFGGKVTLNIGILIAGIFSSLTPIFVGYFEDNGLIILQVLTGLGQGCAFPACAVLLSAWTPSHSRSIIGSTVFGGSQFGAVLGFGLSGFLIDYFQDWAIPFYLFGTLGIIWSISFQLVCYKDPLNHPFITEDEKNYLENELGQLTRNTNLPLPPWKNIMKSSPMWALIIAQIGHAFGLFVMLSDLPKYMDNVVKFSMTSSSLYIALPYVFMFIVGIISGIISDYLIRTDKFSITLARKVFTSIAAIGPAIFMVLASYAGCDKLLVVICFAFAMATMGTYYAGMKVNTLDLSPNYAGSLMAVVNGFGALTGVITPNIVGHMTPNATLMEWRSVFWVTFAVFVSTTVVYILYASGDVQSWDQPGLRERLSRLSTNLRRSMFLSRPSLTH